MDREAKKFIKGLRAYAGVLSQKTIKTLRGQALSGDIEGARRGLEKGVSSYGRAKPD